MKYIYMAAGKGTRISRYINDVPKCLLEIMPGKKLLEFTLEQLIDNGINPRDIAIVVGYKAEVLESAVKKFNINVYYNPFYDVTNSIASCWFARDFMQSEFTALNADTFFTFDIIEELEQTNHETLMLSDSSNIVKADYRFNWEGEKLLKYGKDLSIKETTGEYVGLARVSGSAVKQFHEDMDQLIHSQKHDCWWEDVLYKRIEDGRIVNVKDIKGRYWREIDFLEDYESIKEHLDLSK